jgi:hypothetical protein
LGWKAAQARGAAQLEELCHALPPPRSPGAQRELPILIGRQRTKSGASSDAEGPELPPRSPRGGLTGTLGRSTNK